MRCNERTTLKEKGGYITYDLSYHIANLILVLCDLRNLSVL